MPKVQKKLRHNATDQNKIATLNQKLYRQASICGVTRIEARQAIGDNLKSVLQPIQAQFCQEMSDSQALADATALCFNQPYVSKWLTACIAGGDRVLPSTLSRWYKTKADKFFGDRLTDVTRLVRDDILDAIKEAKASCTLQTTSTLHTTSVNKERIAALESLETLFHDRHQRVSDYQKQFYRAKIDVITKLIENYQQQAQKAVNTGEESAIMPVTPVLGMGGVSQLDVAPVDSLSALASPVEDVMPCSAQTVALHRNLVLSNTDY